MKTFIAYEEKTYSWYCPYCGRLCDGEYEDPSNKKSIICKYCKKESQCTCIR